ncbi:sodium/myo-inositol cotransporter-like [Antedon mediterranea]|uniref:sodium/myo-inositol cotransporter-like n=1 Tax=Antedon mediterranea TaxID=105859 RepID=UPI003AFA013F
MATNQLNAWDFAAIAIYILLVLAVAMYSLCRSNRGTVSGYFLAGRSMFWLPVGASLFVSNIGTEHFIGLAGSGAASGIGVGAFELNACILLQLTGWVFLPVYIASGINTLPEYMKKRYGGQRIRVYLAFLSLLLYILAKISIDIYSGALFIQQALGWNIYVSIIALLGITALCTVTGGLAAVMLTDTLQFFIMICGATAVMILSLKEVGGYENLKIEYMKAIPNETLNSPNSTCGYPREDAWQMLRDPWNSDIPWIGFLLGKTPASIWYWCADQMMVQRVLAAKSLSHAQGGCLFASYIKLLPLFIMVIPGMVSRVLYTDEVACASAETCMEICGSSTGCSNIAYPKLVLGLLPAGFRGIMLAVMLAALMSDLTSIFNSTSTLFTIDIWKVFRIRCFKKEPSIRELMIVGRFIVIVMVVISVLLIPVLKDMQSGQIFFYLQEIGSYLAPPIAAVYLVAVLWPRGNEKGAFWSLMAGFVTGIIRMILDWTWRSPPCWGEDHRPAITAKVHYMYFALILFVVTVLVNIIVSLLTEPPEQFQVIRTTYWTRYSTVKRPDDGEPPPYEEDGIELENTESLSNGAVVEIRKEVSCCKKGYDWFCGFDDSVKGRLENQKYEDRLKKINTLKQDKRAKIFLNINLVVILGVATFCYIFFSV